MPENYLIDSAGIYDECEIIENATVIVWHNSITDEYSIGWYKDSNPPIILDGDSLE